MKTTDAVAYFGTAAALARALGISSAAVSQWPEQVPALRAYQLQHLTRGALQADGPASAPPARR